MKILLDKINGDINIGDLIVTHSFSISDIENLKNRYKVVFVIENPESSFYRISYLDDGNSGALFMFKRGQISQISIAAGSNYNFPPYIITDDERKIIKEAIISIGGERKYSWGSIFYDEDNKGGSVSVAILYNQNE